MLTLCSVYSCSLFNNNIKNQTNCSDWSKIDFDEYEITNNVWGRAKADKYSQCIFAITNNKKTSYKTIGWSWYWPKENDGVKAYPSILYGYKPWNNYSTTQSLPKMIGELKHLNVTYNLKTADAGGVNLLLESWITRSKNPTPEDRVGELAIQLYQKNWPGQAGVYIESTVINGISFDFYIEKKMRVPGDNHTWVYYGFVNKGTPVLKAKIDIINFVNYLVKRGYVNKKQFIATVELGNEVDYGKGKTKIKHFSVQVSE